ncbi:hypothetical protein [Pseudooceanicola sp. LIPI14-2-Ac024]|uniref:hypothetical protein n=1 Tax=Pseudooceanicola sp. LIPI14-2-Ac024 TaxID=3344875 RepID=UPI0035D0AA00
MMRLTLTAIALGLSATALAAMDGPMSGAEFDAYSQGKTFYYGADGEAYGVEEYMSDRKVRWSFLDGDCKEGHWYEEAGGLICFVYDDTPGDPQCWSFYQGPRGLVARFENNPQSTELYEVENSTDPMMCKGPEVGV